MVGIFGTIDEKVEGRRDLSHADRFGRPPFTSLPWRAGRDLLLLDADPGRDRVDGVPRRPMHRTDAELWFPAHDAGGVVGPVHPVGVRAAGPLIRCRAAAPVRFVPGALARLGELRTFVLLELDGLDPSRVRHLARVLAGAEGLTPEALARVMAVRLGRDVDAAGQLPPAARTILRQVAGSPLGTHHERAYERRGASPLVRLLQERALIVVLPDGQLVDRERLEEMARSLQSSPAEASPQQAAGLWRTSVGMARALLKQMRTEGLLDSQGRGTTR